MLSVSEKEQHTGRGLRDALILKGGCMRSREGVLLECSEGVIVSEGEEVGLKEGWSPTGVARVADTQRVVIGCNRWSGEARRRAWGLLK